MKRLAGAPACIVLAAGSSSRFGADKRQAPMPDGRSLLETTLAGIPPVFSHYLLVLHPGDEDLARRHAPVWQSVIADEAALGMGHSLAAGLAACPPCPGAVIVLGDMPRVKPATHAAIAAALQHTRIVLPRYRGQRGNPTGIGADFFSELLTPAADQGARRLLQSCPAALFWVDCDDPGILADVDTRADLERV